MSLNGFFKRLLGLFCSKPLCRKLGRNTRYLAKYKVWLESGAAIAVGNAFFKAYHYKKAGVTCPYRIQLIDEQQRQGVILFYTPALKVQEFSFLFDYIKEQVVLQGYQLRTADRRKLPHKRYTQHTETYCLTPTPSDMAGTKLCNQLYGNILIDYTLINNHPGYIRLIADPYKDVHFSDPLPFPELLSRLLQVTDKA